jgi:hypothetical protein
MVLVAFIGRTSLSVQATFHLPPWLGSPVEAKAQMMESDHRRIGRGGIGWMTAVDEPLPGQIELQERMFRDALAPVAGAGPTESLSPADAERMARGIGVDLVALS